MALLMKTNLAYSTKYTYNYIKFIRTIKIKLLVTNELILIPTINYSS